MPHRTNPCHPTASRTAPGRASLLTIVAVSLTVALFQMPLLLYAQAQDTTSGSSKLIERANPTTVILHLPSADDYWRKRNAPSPSAVHILRQPNYWDERAVPSPLGEQKVPVTLTSKSDPDATTTVQIPRWAAPQEATSGNSKLMEQLFPPPKPSPVGILRQPNYWDVKPPAVPPAVEAKGDIPAIEHVAMTKTIGGVFVVPAEINGLPLNFVVDSGAAAVMVPAELLERMRRDGTVTNEDILGLQTFTLADGTRRTWTAFMIRSLKVGGVVVQNIRGGAIVPALSAPESSERTTPLLGQSFLARVQSWSIDNARLELVIEPGVQREAAKNPPATPLSSWQPVPRYFSPSPCSLQGCWPQ
jgi:clan AA aspartic protease (TIGR02281 family)